MQRSELVEKLQAFSTPTVLIPMWAWLWMKPIGLVFDLDFLLQIVEEKNGHGENIDKRKRKGNINQTNFIHKYDGTYLLLSWFPILSYWLAKMENRNFQTQKRFWMKSHFLRDRGRWKDFKIIDLVIIWTTRKRYVPSYFSHELGRVSLRNDNWQRIEGS